MESEAEALQFVPVENWVDLENAFKADGPRGIPAYNALVNQKKVLELGLDYGFKVYCPYGDVLNGMVAFNKKISFNEVIIQCPKDDTSHMEEALLSTKLIDWSKNLIAPFMPDHMLALIRRVAAKIGMELGDHEPYYIVFYGKDRPLFDVRLPEDVKFEHLSEEHINLIDSLWVNQYDGSRWFFNMLLKMNTGYGLFKRNELVCWVFINEIGALSHLFTLENHRRMGYAKVLIQLVSNIRVKENKDMYACCLNVNNSALKLYENLGFEKFHTVKWASLAPRALDLSHS